jgi:hypothetical protein
VCQARAPHGARSARLVAAAEVQPFCVRLVPKVLNQFHLPSARSGSGVAATSFRAKLCQHSQEYGVSLKSSFLESPATRGFRDKFCDDSQKNGWFPINLAKYLHADPAPRGTFPLRAQKKHTSHWLGSCGDTRDGPDRAKTGPCPLKLAPRAQSACDTRDAPLLAKSGASHRTPGNRNSDAACTPLPRTNSSGYSPEEFVCPGDWLRQGSTRGCSFRLQ